MYNLSVNKLPESLTPAVGRGIIDYESPNLDYAYNSVFENESDIHNYRIMPTQIKEAMVLWYDIARQGCTNENMAENPVLRDLSGNGYDATCYNFAWTEESGISTENYPNALVSDGVDDYARVFNLPVFNINDGYTVFAKRKWLSTVYTSSEPCLASKRNNDEGGVGDYSGAFQFERILNYKDNPNYQTTYSFGRQNSVVFKEGITYQTSTRYNDEIIRINSSESIDTNTLSLFNWGVSYANLSSSVALYAFLLFNRDLTPEEIEWVKRNLV